MDRNRLRMLFDLTGRVAIVTGGTRGIGRAIAEGFVAAGAKVVVASRKPEACAETEAHLVAMGGEALGVPTHTGEIDALRPLVDRTLARFGRLDIVVNNAANALRQDLGRFTPEAWEKSYAVNLRGPVFLVQAALLHFTRSMGAEFAARGIRVNALAPGTVDTDMVRNNPPEMQKLMAAASPMKRAASPDEMVGPALFLVSDAASFVTGQVVIADGGLVSR